MEPIVGIDLGTTNSEIAFIINGRAEVLKEDNQAILPSCVGFDKNGQVFVGLEAKNQAIIAPERTVLSIKRKMGSDARININGTSYRPQEISAFILKSLKKRAETVLGREVRQAVITVPAYFTDAQRQATREAGEIAGLNVVRILNEPTAAALAYESQSKATQTVMVYDLGGGTFDVSIVKIENGVVEVLSSTGDNHLGGDDFDNKIIDLLVEHLHKEHKLAVRDDRVAMARLKRAAEGAKIALSQEPFTVIEEDHIGKRLLKSVHLSYELSRGDFEALIEDDLLKTMESVNKALEDAGKHPADLDKIILVGGSTRIPAIVKMLEEKTGLKPHGEVDPDLCVALGAAIQAGREMGLESSGILLDITPYTFGTSAIGELNGQFVLDRYVPMIQRNSKLPISRSEAFATVYDRQERVDIKIYQGEQPLATANIEIGSYDFELSKLPAHSTIVMNFDLDVNGILKIRAVEKKTGKDIQAVIKNAFPKASAQELTAVRDKIDGVWRQGRDETPPMPNQSGAIAPALNSSPEPSMAQAPSDEISRLLRDAEAKLAQVSAQDVDELVNLIEDLKDAKSSGNPEKIGKIKQELEDLLFYLET
jgi:molecular chaperone DnaK (HSP70)